MSECSHNIEVFAKEQRRHHWEQSFWTAALFLQAVRFSGKQPTLSSADNQEPVSNDSEPSEADVDSDQEAEEREEDYEAELQKLRDKNEKLERYRNQLIQEKALRREAPLQQKALSTDRL